MVIQPWMFSTLLATLGWALWAFFSKLSQVRGATAVQSLVITTSAQIVGTAIAASMQNAASSNKDGGFFFNLPTVAILLAAAAGLCTSAGNTFYSLALGAGGGAAVVTALTGLYPAVTYVLTAVFLAEPVNWMSVAGVVFAILSGLCFVLA